MIKMRHCDVRKQSQGRRGLAISYSVSQSGEVQSFFVKVGAQGLAPLHMYLTLVRNCYISY
jgi:hypothetical protein